MSQQSEADAAAQLRRSYGNNRFGGNTFGGQTFGGYRAGGNTFGKSAKDESLRDLLARVMASAGPVPDALPVQSPEVVSDPRRSLPRSVPPFQVLPDSLPPISEYPGGQKYGADLAATMPIPPFQAPGSAMPPINAYVGNQTYGSALPPQSAAPPSTMVQPLAPAPAVAQPQAIIPDISSSSAGPEYAGPMSSPRPGNLQPAGMDQMGLAEQMAAREELARALNGTGGSNMLTRLFGMG